MKIASHLQPGTVDNALHSKLSLYEPYDPKCAWPEDCTVQWGSGIVPANPFFEAFVPGTFLRGDGATLEEAEQRAFDQYQREFACDHQWGRSSKRGVGVYLNGSVECRHCRAWRMDVLPPIVALGHHRRPLASWENDFLKSMDEDAKLSAIMDEKYPDKIADRRKSQRVLTLRKKLFGVDETRSGSWS